MTKREKLLTEALRALLHPEGRNSVYADAADVLAMIEAEDTAKADKAAGAGAEAFLDAFCAAKAAAFAADPHWHLRDDRVLATLPARLAGFTTERGVRVRWPRDVHMPPARYWPSGKLPSGLTLHRDYARETGPVTLGHQGQHCTPPNRQEVLAERFPRLAAHLSSGVAA